MPQRLRLLRRPCSAVGCQSEQSKKSSVSFFRFPKDPVKRKAWEMNMGRKDWHASDASLLCSEHFMPDCYNEDLRLLAEFRIPVKKLRLRPDAVPTVFAHRPILQAKHRGAFEKRRRKEVVDAILRESGGNEELDTQKEHSPLGAEASVEADPCCLGGANDSLTSTATCSTDAGIQNDCGRHSEYVQVFLRPVQRHVPIQTTTKTANSVAEPTPLRHPCCAVGCQSEKSKESSVSFFKFPKEPVKRKAWEMNVGRKDWRACDTSVLCSEHFTPDSYSDDLRLLSEFRIPVKRLRLRPDAVPTVFAHQPILQAKGHGALEKHRREEVIDAILRESGGNEELDMQKEHFPLGATTAVEADTCCLGGSNDSLTSTASCSTDASIQNDCGRHSEYVQVFLRPGQRHVRIQTTTKTANSGSQTDAVSPDSRDVGAEDIGNTLVALCCS
ncbi:uncharacterized protein LOC142583253 [Dermacentor variabilis]|uniref:uncharacterized protein LOC142583253 n=1 Tax=Dermacentor variabilis TaxID=34621 RepID=UPI003F5C6716